MSNSMAISETYLDAQQLMKDTVNKFKWRYGGNEEDLLSEANQVFMRAWANHNPACGKFLPWLRYEIWHNLLSTARNIAKKAERLQRQYQNLDTVVQVERFNMDAFVGDLSKDAAMIAKLVVEPPIDVMLTAAQFKGMKNPFSVRAAIVEYLKDFGWAMSRITRSFNEITEALS